jgi:hypothetical protein
LNKESKDSDLFVFIDGGGKCLFNPTWWTLYFKSVKVILHRTNLGLANSIIYGVDYVLSRHSTVIVVEDDLIVSRHFLRFMNDALKKYQKDDRVISVHGYTFIETKENYFIKGADTWGWATWKDRWELFDRNAKRLVPKVENRRKEFDYFGGFRFTKMLKMCAENKVDSWGIRWNASAFVMDKLTLYPKVSLVDNVGDSGTNTSGWDFSVGTSDTPVPVTDIPVEESVEMRKKIGKKLRGLKLDVIKRRLIGLLGKTK